MKITLKKDGSIELNRGAFAPRIIGDWNVENVWKENGSSRDASGNKLVHYMWNATLRNGLRLMGYTRKELTNQIKQYC